MKNPWSVPATPATSTVAEASAVAVADSARHSTDVPLTHDDVPQLMAARAPFGEPSVG